MAAATCYFAVYSFCNEWDLPARFGGVFIKKLSCLLYTSGKLVITIGTLLSFFSPVAL